MVSKVIKSSFIVSFLPLYMKITSVGEVTEIKYSKYDLILVQY